MFEKCVASDRKLEGTRISGFTEKFVFEVLENGMLGEGIPPGEQLCAASAKTLGTYNVVPGEG
jgi:hypothetical protein